jgi:hypothetical protein
VSYGQLSSCPSWTKQWREYCYFFNNNQTAKVTWEQAGQECRAVNMDLLRIEDVEEWVSAHFFY